MFLMRRHTEYHLLVAITAMCVACPLSSAVGNKPTSRSGDGDAGERCFFECRIHHREEPSEGCAKNTADCGGCLPGYMPEKRHDGSLVNCIAMSTKNSSREDASGGLTINESMAIFALIVVGLVIVGGVIFLWRKWREVSKDRSAVASRHDEEACEPCLDGNCHDTSTRQIPSTFVSNPSAEVPSGNGRLYPDHVVDASQGREDPAPNQPVGETLSEENPSGTQGPTTPSQDDPAALSTSNDQASVEAAMEDPGNVAVHDAVGASSPAQ